MPFKAYGQLKSIKNPHVEGENALFDTPDPYCAWQRWSRWNSDELYTTAHIKNVANDDQWKMFKGTGETFTFTFDSADELFQTKCWDSDVGPDPPIGMSDADANKNGVQPMKIEDYIKKSSTGMSQGQFMEQAVYNYPLPLIKKYEGTVRLSVCMDTLDWTSNGQTCDQLDGSKCDIKTESAMPGVDLSTVSGDPASNCCACGKRF